LQKRMQTISALRDKITAKTRATNCKHTMNTDESSHTLKLIHTGFPFIDFKSNPNIYVIPCYFQPWLVENKCAVDNTIITQVVNSNLAGELICGSLWTKWKNLTETRKYSPFDSQVFWTGANPLSIIQLQNVINLSDLTPASFWITQGETWVICISFSEKKIIIPYFELLRVLFYNASRRLTQYFFSQSPLELLCRSLSLPSAQNSFLTHFCVASEELSVAEARILGGLSSDSAMIRVFNFARTYFHNVPTMKSGFSHKTKEISAGQLNKNILFNAKGYNFKSNNENYFWVDSLEIITSPFNFRQAIFHPLESLKSSLSMPDTLPLCSDLLQAKTYHARLSELHNRTGNYSSLIHRVVPYRSSKRESKFIRGIDTRLPYIKRGLPWAKVPTDKNNFCWFDESLFNKLEHNKILPSSFEPNYTNEFKNLLSKFTSSGYPARFLTINNAQGLCGKDTSVFPVHGHPPLPNTIYKNLIRKFTLVEIELSNGPIFLAQPFPKECPDLIVLFQKQSLNYPNDLEFNELFNAIFPVYNYEDFRKFRRKAVALTRKKTPPNSALIALPIPLKKITVDLCLDISIHTANKFRKRLQFLVASLQKYPTGISEIQRKAINKLSSNICMSPDSNLLAALASYWHHGKL